MTDVNDDTLCALPRINDFLAPQAVASVQPPEISVVPTDSSVTSVPTDSSVRDPSSQRGSQWLLSQASDAPVYVYLSIHVYVLTSSVHQYTCWHPESRKRWCHLMRMSFDASWIRAGVHHDKSVRPPTRNQRAIARRCTITHS